jgi:hypothetical protein
VDGDLAVLTLEALSKHALQQFLAVEAHGWFLARVYKESVRDLRTRFEGAVDPERPPTPHLLRRSPSDGVSHTLSCPQSRAVIGDLVGTFLVEILITSLALESLFEEAKQ